MRVAVVRLAHDVLHAGDRADLLLDRVEDLALDAVGRRAGIEMPTVSHGGATSGNSSVFSLSSANMPKTTSATIATTVIERRLIAKSEMNMWHCLPNGSMIRWLLLCVGAARDTFTGVPPRCRAPRRGASCRPAATPARDLDRLRRRVANAELDLRPSRTLPFLIRTTVRPQAALVHRARAATIGAVRASLATRPRRTVRRRACSPAFGMRHDDAHLARRRIGDRIDARDRDR